MGAAPSKETVSLFSYFRGSYEVGLIPLTRHFFGADAASGEDDHDVGPNADGWGHRDTSSGAVCEPRDTDLFPDPGAHQHPSGHRGVPPSVGGGAASDSNPPARLRNVLSSPTSVKGASGSGAGATRSTEPGPAHDLAPLSRASEYGHPQRGKESTHVGKRPDRALLRRQLLLMRSDPAVLYSNARERGNVEASIRKFLRELRERERAAAADQGTEPGKSAASTANNGLADITEEVYREYYWQVMPEPDFTEADLDRFLDLVDEALYESDADMVHDVRYLTPETQGVFAAAPGLGDLGESQLWAASDDPAKAPRRQPRAFTPIPCALCLAYAEGKERSGCFSLDGRNINIIGYFGCMTAEMQRAFKVFKRDAEAQTARRTASTDARGRPPVEDTDHVVRRATETPPTRTVASSPPGQVDLFLNTAILTSAGDRTLERVLVLAAVMLRQQFHTACRRVLVDDKNNNSKERIAQRHTQRYLAYTGVAEGRVLASPGPPSSPESQGFGRLGHQGPAAVSIHSGADLGAGQSEPSPADSNLLFQFVSPPAVESACAVESATSRVAGAHLSASLMDVSATSPTAYTGASGAHGAAHGLSVGGGGGGGGGGGAASVSSTSALSLCPGGHTLVRPPPTPPHPPPLAATTVEAMMGGAWSDPLLAVPLPPLPADAFRAYVPPTRTPERSPTSKGTATTRPPFFPPVLTASATAAATTGPDPPTSPSIPEEDAISRGFAARLGCLTMTVESSSNNYSSLKSMTENFAFLHCQVDLDPEDGIMELIELPDSAEGGADDEDGSTSLNHHHTEKALGEGVDGAGCKGGVGSAAQQQSRRNPPRSPREADRRVTVLSPSSGVLLTLNPTYFTQATLWASSLFHFPARLPGGHWIQYKLKDECEQLRQVLQTKDTLIAHWRQHDAARADRYLGPHTARLLAHVQALQTETERVRRRPASYWEGMPVYVNQDARRYTLHRSRYGVMLIGVRAQAAPTATAAPGPAGEAGTSTAAGPGSAGEGSGGGAGGASLGKLATRAEVEGRDTAATRAAESTGAAAAAAAAGGGGRGGSLADGAHRDPIAAATWRRAPGVVGDDAGLPHTTAGVGGSAHEHGRRTTSGPASRAGRGGAARDGGHGRGGTGAGVPERGHACGLSTPGSPFVYHPPTSPASAPPPPPPPPYPQHQPAQPKPQPQPQGRGGELGKQGLSMSYTGLRPSTNPFAGAPSVDAAHVGGPAMLASQLAAALGVGLVPPGTARPPPPPSPGAAGQGSHRAPVAGRRPPSSSGQERDQATGGRPRGAAVMGGDTASLLAMLAQPGAAAVSPMSESASAPHYVSSTNSSPSRVLLQQQQQQQQQQQRASLAQQGPAHMPPTPGLHFGMRAVPSESPYATGTYGVGQAMTGTLLQTPAQPAASTNGSGSGSGGGGGGEATGPTPVADAMARLSHILVAQGKLDEVQRMRQQLSTQRDQQQQLVAHLVRMGAGSASAMGGEAVVTTAVRGLTDTQAQLKVCEQYGDALQKQIAGELFRLQQEVNASLAPNSATTTMVAHPPSPVVPTAATAALHAGGHAHSRPAFPVPGVATGSTNAAGGTAPVDMGYGLMPSPQHYPPQPPQPPSYAAVTAETTGWGTRRQATPDATGTNASASRGLDLAELLSAFSATGESVGTGEAHSLFQLPTGHLVPSPQQQSGSSHHGCSAAALNLTSPHAFTAAPGSAHPFTTHAPVAGGGMGGSAGGVPSYTHSLVPQQQAPPPPPPLTASQILTFLAPPMEGVAFRHA